MLNLINTILGLGASVVMPIIIFVIGIIFGMKPLKALIAGLTVGVGFIGINLVTGMMNGYLTPIIEGLQSKFNIVLDVYDIGWPVSSGIAFSSGMLVIAMFIILILINVIMLLLNWTNTLNVDLWNFWNFIMAAALVYALSGSFVIGCICGGIYGAIVLYMSDKHEKVLGDFLGQPGVTITTQSFSLTLYLCMGINWVLEQIPGINKINFSFGKVKDADSDKYSVLTEPILLGFILGLVLSVVSGVDWKGSLTAGIGMGTVMFLLPKMVSVLIDGISPVSKAAQEFLSKRFPDRHLNIGMDLAICLGDKDVITMAMIMIPVTIVLAMILPFNRMLPFMDLPSMPYTMVAPVIAGKRNSFRTFIISVCICCLTLFIATDLAPIFTSVAVGSGIIDASSGMVSALSCGGNLIAWIEIKIIQLLQNIF
ncbi:MAG: hypothetical protein IKF68_07605 [Erysipelotrichaceae bacterium]|nr:hypothetical protein [Erysipelotrichaceae bacterium]